MKVNIVVYKVFLKYKKRISGFAALVLISSLVIPITFLTNREPASAVTSCTSGSFSEVASSDGNSFIVTFSAPAGGTGSCTFEVPNNVFALDYLVIAGGGGGASGGGGGGGFVTSWRTQNEAGNSVDTRQAPLSVNAGDAISVTIGAGGAGGAAGNWRGAQTGYTTLPGNGGNSVFGSVTAEGGGAGGHNEIYVTSGVANDNLRNGTGQSGGSGGGAAFDQNNVALVSSSSQSTVVGANTRGNAGGSSQGTGGFRAGAGGGGAGAIGGPIRSCNNGNLANSLGCGGHGADGLLSDIANFTNTYVEYSCGGGGGVNANVDRAVNNGGGDAGCGTSGKGSAWGNTNTNYTVTTASTNANATSGSAGFGGGGGGTDPEDTRGGAGGSGVVIVRYLINDSDCPNNSSPATSLTTYPLACQASVTVVAGGAAQTVSAAAAPISYPNPNSATTLALVTTVSGMTLTVVNNAVQISVTSATSSLIGGTYPVTYSLTDQLNGRSENYILVNVSDPGQHTPVVVPVDPRATTLDLPAIIIGTVDSVLMCVRPVSNSGGYSNQITVTLTNGATSTALTGGGIRFTGTNAQISANAAALRVTADTGVIVAGPNTRVLDVNISNSATGGNGTCNGGTQSTITLRPLLLGQSFKKGTIQLKN